MATSTAVRTLNNGKHIPWIGYGTGTALFHRSVENHIALAFSAGIQHIDTADMYGNEDSVGVGLHNYLTSPSKPSRDSIFVTTKLDKVPAGGTVKEALKDSLRKLQLDYVDLYLIHSPIPYKGRIKDVWKEFEGVYEEGLAKAIGVSNFRLGDFGEFIDEAKVIPAVNQIEFHPYVLSVAEPLLEFHKKHDIQTLSFGGLVPISRKAGGPLEGVLPTIAARLSKDAGKEVNEGQILIKWILAKDVLPITTSSKKERLVNILETISLPDLTPEEVNAINTAGKKIHHRVYQKHMDL